MVDISDNKSPISSKSAAMGVKLAAVAACTLAVTNVLTPMVYASGANTITVLFLRALTTALVVGGVLVLRGRLRYLSLKQEFYCVISGILFMFAGIGLLGSFALIPASLAVLVLYLFPILTIVIDAFVRRTVPKPVTLFLLVVALGGLAMVLEVDRDFEISLGVALAALAAFSAASTFVWNNHMLADADPEQITLRMFLVSFLFFGVWLLSKGDFVMPANSVGLLQLFTVLGAFALAFLVMFRASQMAGSVRASMIMNLEPVVTILLSVVFLSINLSGYQMIGAGLVLAAVFVSQKFVAK